MNPNYMALLKISELFFIFLLPFLGNIPREDGDELEFDSESRVAVFWGLGYFRGPRHIREVLVAW
jgi:hypothetical protein